METNLILYSVIGLMVAHRTVHLLKFTDIIAVKNEKWLRCLYLIPPIMLLLLVRIGHTNWFWMFAFVFFALPFVVAEIVERRRTREFISETRDFYDEMVFEIRSGNSLRSSLDRIMVGTQFGFYTREMISVSLKNTDDSVSNRETLPRSCNKLIDHRVHELRRLLQSSGKILERLQFMRHVHHLEQKFRRKSRVATRQVRAQAGIVIMLYLGLLTLQLATGFTNLTSPFVFVSLSLIVLGLAVLFHIMRSFKWKV